MEATLSPEEDFRHSLQPGEHEAFYFTFTAPDGRTFGILRTLFGKDSLLEMVVLRRGDRTLIHQSSGVPAHGLPPTEASGPALRLLCEKPWEHWRCSFRGSAQDDRGQMVPLSLELGFIAVARPERYIFGPYTQVQQDGRMRGEIRLGSTNEQAKWVAYRDHSWGVRPMGVAQGWTLVCVPGHLYAVVVETREGHRGFGRWVSPDGRSVGLDVPTVLEGEAGQLTVEAPRAGMGKWQIRCLSPPLTAYLGPAGHEAFRDSPEPGDLLQDKMGPILAMAPDGNSYPGFMERARRIG